MVGKTEETGQLDVFSQFLHFAINPEHRLAKLSKRIDWKALELNLSKYYSLRGRNSKTIRLMVSLFLLKHMYNLSDESVVQHWSENPCYQHFSEAERC